MNHRSPGEFRIALAVLLLLALLISPACAWWDTDYTKRQEITITNPSAVQVLTNVTYDADMQADFDDLRFVDGDDTTVLDHWIESKSDGYYANVWVELADTGSDAYMYYGNAGAESASNGTATFDFFDDFQSYDTNVWQTVSGSPAASGSVLTLENAACYQKSLSSGSFIVEVRAKTSHFKGGATSIEISMLNRADWKGERARFCDTAYEYRGVYTNYDGSYATPVAIEGWDTANFHLLKGVFFGSGVTWYVDRANAKTLTQNYHLSGDESIQLRADGGTFTLWVDWVLIRRYAATEPTFAYGAEEDAPEPPVAAFTANATSGACSLPVSFTDTSTNTPSSWQWNFTDVTGNATPTTFSTDQNPTHTFGEGNYSIILTATNAAGSDASDPTWVNVTECSVPEPTAPIPTYTFPIENWNATRVAGGFSTLFTVTIPLLLETVAANIVMLIIVLGTMLTIKLFLRW